MVEQFSPTVGDSTLGYAVLQPTAASSLKDTKQKQHAQGRGSSAEKGTGGKEKDAEHRETLPPEELRKPTGNRENDRVRNEIARQHPRAFVIAGAAVRAFLRAEGAFQAAR